MDISWWWRSWTKQVRWSFLCWTPQHLSHPYVTWGHGWNDTDANESRMMIPAQESPYLRIRNHIYIYVCVWMHRFSRHRQRLWPYNHHHHRRWMQESTRWARRNMRRLNSRSSRGASSLGFQCSHFIHFERMSVLTALFCTIGVLPRIKTVARPWYIEVS